MSGLNNLGWPNPEHEPTRNTMTAPTYDNPRQDVDVMGNVTVTANFALI